MTLLIKNIKSLVGVETNSKKKLSGKIPPDALPRFDPEGLGEAPRPKDFIDQIIKAYCALTDATGRKYEIRVAAEAVYAPLMNRKIPS